MKYTFKTVDVKTGIHTKITRKDATRMLGKGVFLSWKDTAKRKWSENGCRPFEYVVHNGIHRDIIIRVQK